MNTSSGYLKRLWSALLGKQAGAAGEAGAGESAGEAALRARVAALELDLRERDERIAAMKAEYGQLESDKERTGRSAGEESLEKLFKRLAGSLSNLALLIAHAEKGQQVEIADVISLFKGIEKDLLRAGLERVGEVGQDATFDTAIHQRMSGGTVHANTPVSVRMPGYRMGEKILLKAMVSAKE